MYTLELEWIHRMQSALRSPWMDRFFIAWNYADTTFFWMFLVLVVWYFFNRKIGIRLIYIFLLNGLINGVLKAAFDLPRPCQIDSSLGVLCLLSPGFPSGAAQSAILFSGIIFLETKNLLYRYLGLLFAVFLCFSRIYLGVHFFTDILGGLVVGAVLLLIYGKVFPLMEKRWKVGVWIFPFVK